MTDENTTHPEPVSERDSISSNEIDLVSAGLGYQLQVGGTAVGSIEGVPGYLEYLCVRPHLEGKGIGRAALQAFVEESIRRGETSIEATNATNEKMAHIFETESDWKQTETGWRWSGSTDASTLSE